MKIKIETMTLLQFRGIIKNAEILTINLIKCNHGAITKNHLDNDIAEFLNVNGIHADSDEIEMFTQEVIREQLGL